MGAVEPTWWETLESLPSGSDREDSEHWVRVYGDLIQGLTQILAGLDADSEIAKLVASRLQEAELRRCHWTAGRSRPVRG